MLQRWFGSLPVACLLLAGCTQQDTQTLGRIGRKVIERSHSVGDAIRGQVEVDLQGIPHAAPSAKELSLKDTIELRLRSDARLADAKIDIELNGNEVKLRGSVKSDAQRRHATDLVEATVGVQAIDDALKVEE